MLFLIKTSWRRLEDVLWRRRQRTYSRRLQDIFINTNVCWVSRCSVNLGLFDGRCNSATKIGFDLSKKISIKWLLVSPQKFAFWLQRQEFLIEHATPPSILKRLFSIFSLLFKIDESIVQNRWVYFVFTNSKYSLIH